MVSPGRVPRSWSGASDGRRRRRRDVITDTLVVPTLVFIIFVSGFDSGNGDRFDASTGDVDVEVCFRFVDDAVWAFVGGVRLG